MILYGSGDVERNPGPYSKMTTSSDDGRDSDIASYLFCQYLSIVHYNVKSLLPKLELIEWELSKFHCIAFTETWLNQSIPNNDICIQGFKPPYRYDWPHDSHDGVAVYVNETLF